MNVTVFCGSRPNPQDYEAAYQLGRLLAAAGHTVLTGGYIGGMEAVSRGAQEAGGYVVGVTCDEIEAWRAVKPNAWITEERRCDSLNKRLAALIEGCDAAIALPGGPGTLTEICLMWNQLVIEAISPRPVVLVGDGWKTVFESLFAAQGEYIPPAQRAWLKFAADGREAIAMLTTA